MIWRLVRRGVFAVVSAYIVMTAAFAVIAFTNDPNVGQVAWEASNTGRNITEAVQAYREARNLNDPIFQRWVSWLVGITTGDWGLSYSTGQPVLDVIWSRMKYTLFYLVPSVFVATVMGISFGLFSAFRQHSFSDRIVTAAAYLGLGIPNFWLATVLFSAAVAQHQIIAFPELPITSAALYSFDFTLLYGFIPWLDPNTTQGFFVLPVITLTTALLAGQLRYTRSESLEYIDMEFVKIARAKGAGPFRVARHVLRNAAIPLLSLFLTEMLSVLVLGVLVIEEVFNIPGFGSLMLQAVGARDMPLIIGVTMVVAFIGIVGNFLQDVAYTVLDPRVGSETD
ncbi:ABC transporter permease [Haloarchaeobius iranensis]|uniref:Peptide/nickel transport system permease protein n=1 Tax=Haloarchaeobius iranensis TaxID=996166 RepID=A0A1G9T376_9EURY|nr:ABC transporter permease [Haloarchaeobius iranensis]SDM42086.1 peptide/nickel transport system permease protein [Haloarchaeobius iranensis]